MVAGRPGAARSVPAGRRRRNGARPTSAPIAARPTPTKTLRAPSAPRTKAAPTAVRTASADPVLVGGWCTGSTEADERRHGDGSGQRDQRDQTEEHPAPAEQVATAAATPGPDDARDHPGGRQHRHHPGPLGLAQGPADGDVGHRGHRPRAESLQAAADDQHPHERGEPGHERGRPRTAPVPPRRDGPARGGRRRARPRRSRSGWSAGRSRRPSRRGPARRGHGPRPA